MNTDQIQQMAQMAVDAYLPELQEETERATKATAEGKDAREMAATLTDALGIYALGDPESMVIKAIIRHMTEARDALADMGRVDRDRGDEVVGYLTGALLLSGDDALKAEVAEAIDAWKATAPKATRGGGSRNEKGSGTPLEFRCSCGWSNVDRTDANSAKWSFYGHLAHKKEGHGFTERPNGNHPLNAPMTELFRQVSKDGITRVSESFTAPDGKEYRVAVGLERGGQVAN